MYVSLDLLEENVSTHASVRRRPQNTSSTPHHRCFNSRLREEATWQFTGEKKCGSFNSRLREEATFDAYKLSETEQVSTHASVRRRQKPQKT